MRKLAGATFTVLAVLAEIVVVACLYEAPATARDHGREPEDFVRLGLGLAITVALAVFWSAGALRAFSKIRRPPGSPEWAGVAVIGLIGAGALVLAALESVDRIPPLVLGLVVLASVAAYTQLVRSTPPAA